MAVISTLVARMVADLSGWTPNMEKGKRDMSSFGSAAKGLQKTLIGLGVGFSALGASRLILGISRAADETADMAAALGVTVPDMQRLKFISAATLTPVDALARGLRNISVKLFEGEQGSNSMQRAMRRLGITADQLNGGPIAAMRNLSSAFSRYQGADRYAIAYQLLGKSASEVLPVLLETPQALDRIIDRAEKLGVVFSKTTADTAAFAASIKDQLVESLKALATKRLAFYTAYLGGGGKELQDEIAKYEKMAKDMPFGTLQHGKQAFMSPTSWAVNMAMQSLARKHAETGSTTTGESIAEDIDKRAEAFRKLVETPMDHFNAGVDEANKLLHSGAITSQEYSSGIAKFREELEKTIRANDSWVDSLIEKSLTPMQKYKDGLMEVLKLREYFMRDTVLSSGEQVILKNLTGKYQEEAADALKPERVHRQRPSFAELSPMMSVSGLQLGETIQERQADDIAAIRSKLEMMTKEYLN